VVILSKFLQSIRISKEFLKVIVSINSNHRKMNTFPIIVNPFQHGTGQGVSVLLGPLRRQGSVRKLPCQILKVSLSVLSQCLLPPYRWPPPVRRTSQARCVVHRSQSMHGPVQDHKNCIASLKLFRPQLVTRSIWQGVSTDSLKFHPGLQCPSIPRPAGGPPSKRPYGRF
jgi:hypothetical protein